MAHYLIEFRLGGYAKRYSQSLIYELFKKFRLRGMKDRVSHISLFGPFQTNNEQRMVNEVIRIAKHYGHIPFKFKNFNCFNGPNKVIYLDILPSEDLKRFRYELAQALLKVTKKSSFQDKKDKDRFEFHSTLAFKDLNQKFNSVWNYLKNKEPPIINQFLLRVTILKNSRILYEYDFFTKRLLNRHQALNSKVFRNTITKLREVKNNFHKPMKFHPTNTINKKPSNLWGKIKSIFIKK